jgi:hypothetical protein
VSAVAWDRVLEAANTGEQLRPDVYQAIWTILEGKLSPMVRNADLTERMAKDWARDCVDFLVAEDAIPAV